MNKITVKNLGKAAFKNGALRVPALDSTLFVEYLTGAQIGDREARQWLAGWDDEANLGTSNQSE